MLSPSHTAGTGSRPSHIPTPHASKSKLPSKHKHNVHVHVGWEAFCSMQEFSYLLPVILIKGLVIIMQ